jgi:hypothetical protein
MNLQEANARLKKTQLTEEQLWGLSSLYILLDLHKDVFCKIVDAVGVETLTARHYHYDRAVQAREEFEKKEKYQRSKKRLADLKSEIEQLTAYVDDYREMYAKENNAE